MKATKEINIIKQSVRFTFELSLQEAQEYMKHLESHKIEETFELIPDDIIVYLLNYYLKQHAKQHKKR